VKSREGNVLWCFLLKTEKFFMMITISFVTLIIFSECLLHVIGINFVGYEEIVIIFAFWMYMLGSAYGSYDNSHIRADVLSVVMKESARKDFLSLLEKVVTLLLGLVFLYWAITFIIWSTNAGGCTPAWRIPNVVGQSSVVVGLILMMIYNIVHLYDEWIKFSRKHILKDIKEIDSGSHGDGREVK